MRSQTRFRFFFFLYFSQPINSYKQIRRKRRKKHGAEKQPGGSRTHGRVGKEKAKKEKAVIWDENRRKLRKERDKE